MFIFEILTLEVHSIIVVPKADEVRAFCWTLQDNLIFCWGNAAFGIWGQEMIAALNPSYSKPFKPVDLTMTKDRSAVVLKSGKSYCLFYPEQTGLASHGRSSKPRADRISDNPFSVAGRDTDSNLRRIDVSMSETVRRSQDIRTEDLINAYDRRNTPEKHLQSGYDTNNTFGGGSRRGQHGDRNLHRFED